MTTEPNASWVTAQPSPHVAAFVEGYIGYRMDGFPAGMHRGLPSRYLTFIVSIGPAIDVVRQTDPAQPPARYRCVLSGLQATPALISHDGFQEGIAIELTPPGCRKLLAMPSRALWNTSVDLADVVGPFGTELWERLQGSASWAVRFAICDDVLGRLAGDHPAPVELSAVWHHLVRTGGLTPVNELADRVGWSRQHLARRFRDEFGLGPKLAARVVRFDRATQMLSAVPSFVTIAQIAASCGYYDQAHLNRDFAELAGCSPTQWLREELPSFQDADEGGAPWWTS